MKVMVRILGLIVIGIFSFLIITQLVNVDTRRDEMTTITSLAMTTTQTVMEEQIYDQINGTNTARKKIESNEEYFDDYLQNFQKLVRSDCKYQVELLDADYEKGLLDINVICNYTDVMGNLKSMSIRKTSIVEQVDGSDEFLGITRYNIEYNLNRGRVMGKNPASFTDRDTDTIELINPAKSGYEFIGWTGYNGNKPNKKVSVDFNIKEHRFYEANYNMLTYDIVYEMNGGVNHSSNPKTYTIETDTFSLSNPARRLYDFVGWTGSNGRTPSKSVKVERGHFGDRNYTANWQPHKYSITYNLNGGVNNINNPINYHVENATITLYEPTRKGYNFNGWYEDGSFNKAITTIKTDRGENLQLYAKWTPKETNVTFLANNGSTNSITKKYIVDTVNQSLLFPNWTMVGHNAIEYICEKGGVTHTHLLTEQVTNDFIIDHEGETTMSVHWGKKTVTVNFHHNDGTNKTTTKKYTYGEPNQTFPLASTFNKTNYTAISFSLVKDGGAVYEVGQSISDAWIDENGGKEINLWVNYKANIIYGYKNATNYSAVFTSEKPIDGFYKEVRQTRDYIFDVPSPGNSLGVMGVKEADEAFKVNKVSVYSWGHTNGGRAIDFTTYGSRNGSDNWVSLCTTRNNPGGYGTESSCEVSNTNKYKYFKSSITDGANSKQQWAWWRIIGVIEADGYNVVTGWSTPIIMPSYNSYSKTQSRKLVYSRDGGATWIDCDNYGSSCPLE